MARAASGQSSTREVDLSAHFAGFNGCFVLKSLHSGETLRYNSAGCDERLGPCSTFKIPNSLIGLEFGVIGAADSFRKWDGVHRDRTALNKDHNLRSAFKDSVVWYYQGVAADVGPQRMQEALNRLTYGNRDISAGLSEFWLNRSLKISANEQVEFLRKLSLGELPLSRRSQEIVREIMVLESTPAHVFRGKTGTGGTRAAATLGWFVGYLERAEETYVFATNIRADTGATGFKAREICAAALKQVIGAEVHWQ